MSLPARNGHIQATRCRACNGTGQWSGILHSGACAHCGGIGAVHPDGSQLSPEEGVTFLRGQLNARNKALREARARLAQLAPPPDPADEILPPGRYQGD